MFWTFRKQIVSALSVQYCSCSKDRGNAWHEDNKIRQRKDTHNIEDSCAECLTARFTDEMWRWVAILTSSIPMLTCSSVCPHGNSSWLPGSLPSFLWSPAVESLLPCEDLEGASGSWGGDPGGGCSGTSIAMLSASSWSSSPSSGWLSSSTSTPIPTNRRMWIHESRMWIYENDTFEMQKKD